MEIESYSFENIDNDDVEEKERMSKQEKREMFEAVIRKLDTSIGEGNSAHVLIDEDFPEICFKILKHPSEIEKEVHLPEKETDFIQKARAAVEDPTIIPAPYFYSNGSVRDANNNEKKIQAIGMERIFGNTIDEIIREEADMPLGLQLEDKQDLKKLQDDFLKIEEEMKKINEAGIFHNDLRSRNIMIAHDGTIKIIDFGMAEKKFHLRNEEIPKKDITSFRNAKDKFLLKAKQYLKNEHGVTFRPQRSSGNSIGPLP